MERALVVMDMNLRRHHFEIVGILILIVSILDSVFLIRDEGFAQLFWYCNAALFVLAFGFILRKSIVFSAVLSSALAVQLPWLADFFSKILAGKFLLGVSAYLFDYGTDTVRFYIELDHLLIIPLSLYGAYHLGTNKHAWKLAAAIAILTNGGAYAFSSIEDNINCVHYWCFSDAASSYSHPMAYLFFWTIAVTLAFYCLNYLIVRLHASYRRYKSDADTKT